MRPVPRWLILAAFVVTLAACAKGHEGPECTSGADCARGERCMDGMCVPLEGSDAGSGGMDAGHDAGSARDAGSSDDGGGVDAGDDAGPDTDASFDAGTDAGPSCTDGVRNGDESDVDCGGSCPACAECAGCSVDADCARGRCATAGHCAIRQELYVDWLAHCSTDGSAGLDVPGLPAGDYTVTALDSAATVWDSPWSPPDTGWFYRIPCDGVSVSTVRTPSGSYYADAATAFANLMATSETASFAGGTIRCEVTDSNCDDNHGGVRFALERSCP